MTPIPDTLRERLSPLGNMHNSDGGAVDRAVARVRRPADRAYLRRAQDLRRLAALARDVRAAAPPVTGPRVLVATLRYWCDHAAFENVLALALRMRGADVAHVVCGGGQPACEVGWARRAEPRPCDRCAHHTATLAQTTGFPAFRLADHLPWGPSAGDAPADVPDIEAAIDVANISIPWFFKVADHTLIEGSQAAVRDFGVAMSGVTAAAERILDAFEPEVFFSLNGLFGPERAIRRVAAARGIRSPTYEIAPRAGALVVSQTHPAPEMNPDAAWALHRERPLTPAQSAALDELLAGRVRGTTSHERYFETPEEDLAVLRRDLAIPDGARVISLFTNLSWDSACLYHDIAYPSMADWMAGAVRAVDGLDGTVLVLRVHPAEERWGTHERAEDALRARVGELPGNVRVVGPDRPLSSYAIVDLSALVLAYTTTVGLEAAVRGVPVAVAGETHYRGRGFTIDLDGHDDLVAAVRSAPGRLTAEQLELARRYAFTFFFRVMVPFPSVRVGGGRVLEMPERAGRLVGADPHLDWVADRILDGAPFFLPDHLALP